MVLVLILLTSIAVLSLSLALSTNAASRERKSSGRSLSCLYVCEAGLSEAQAEAAHWMPQRLTPWALRMASALPRRGASA